MDDVIVESSLTGRLNIVRRHEIETLVLKDHNRPSASRLLLTKAAVDSSSCMDMGMRDEEVRPGV